jgi:hypothetical protein|nr:MAG TPA: hypothetical protein [Caudoviricetes sp.]
MYGRVNLLTATRKAVNKKLSRRQWHIISLSAVFFRRVADPDFGYILLCHVEVF